MTVKPIWSGYPPGEITAVTVRRVSEAGGDGWDAPSSSVSEHFVEYCLVFPRATKDPTDFSQAPEQDAVLYAPDGADVVSTDQIVVPVAHRMRGVYQVNGRPARWRLGVEVLLTWVSD